MYASMFHETLIENEVNNCNSIEGDCVGNS